MERYQKNLDHLELVAEALGEILEDVTFVGGCATVLLVDEAAFGGVRQTEDVDIIVDLATYNEYRKFGAKLRKIGFREAKEGPICRWKKKHADTEIKLDVMPDSKEILGFTNRWYADAMKGATYRELPSRTKIRLVSPAHFLATKFEAFNGRGNGDYAGSHDLEDIVFVLENRTDLMKELFGCSQELKNYLAQQANSLLHEQFLNVLPGLVSGSDGQSAVEGYLTLMSKWDSQ